MFPLIALTGNFADNRLQLLPGYFRSIEAAGGIAVVIPPKKAVDDATRALLDRVDALLLTGGADINPLLCGEEPIPALGEINALRDNFELELIKEAEHRQIPMLGVCRGIQMLAVALGGSIHQDLSLVKSQSLLKHSQQAGRGVATHTVTTEPGSLLRKLLGERFPVNSFHHQAVRQPGPRLRVTARAADGVIEAVESAEEKSVLGVQWHPECFLAEGDRSMMPLFEYLVNEAKSYREAREIHRKLLTLDSHCDTPMFFEPESEARPPAACQAPLAEALPPGKIDLSRRSEKLLVDFPKMREGGLDATVMVAYLPQGACTPEGHEAAARRADSLLRQIEMQVARAENVSLAATPDDLRANKKSGRLSVMRGIENGYALGRDFSAVRRYREMGVVYITLCHNGDNELCDSARRSTGRHGGLSPFGRQVVAEMNRVGLMIDMSHAAESSFYDALALSAAPIVCSHSSSRALCNHPRNLTDAQLRALAAAGGVAQATFYEGFLVESGSATIRDAVRHILHMISVAGIDHVGIGTDFDGDGGVCGLANAAELLNLTRRLRAEGLTEADLQKLWGGNFLRVMQQVQQSAQPAALEA